jgi:hypothetical protein
LLYAFRPCSIQDEKQSPNSNVQLFGTRFPGRPGRSTPAASAVRAPARDERAARTRGPVRPVLFLPDSPWPAGADIPSSLVFIHQPWSDAVSQKIVGNFVVGTVYSSNEIGQWSATWMVRRYGVNNGRIIALKPVPGVFDSCNEAVEKAMELGEEYAKGLDMDSGDATMPGSGDELFIPPTATAQRTDSAA